MFHILLRPGGLSRDHPHPSVCRVWLSGISPNPLGIRASNTVCDVMLMSDYFTDKCGIFTRGFGSCRLLESVYSALGTNSEALIPFGMKGHQVGLG